ncbi:alanine racemase [Enterococcus durans]|uniref:acyltransferase family protein n=1 Tax=Enterococcus durans TaxID=53345 RepID=UPI000E08C05C|nr:acyltransferase [Enterococcus durans]MDB1685607.1 acyltransferase [Enterococcus durans]STP38711.1 alanine racemase [Enterococcus durans]HCB28195.1 transcriptional regulator [Enterococcus sp.]
MENKNQKLYLAQFVATIFVVMIHSGTVIGNPIAHFILKSMICRLAVPFFFINNAYFFHVNAPKSGYKKRWLVKILKTYFKFFLLYIPFGIQLISQSMDNQWNYLPIVVVFSFLYSGSFYHLWYFPALLFSLLFVRIGINKLGYSCTFSICCGLFIVGSLETYSAYISNHTVVSILHKYLDLFLTTRNGLFFSPIFVLVGCYLADNRNRLVERKNKFYLGLVISGLLGVVEGILVFRNQGIDKNFMYFTIVFCGCLFAILLLSKNTNRDFESIKSYSQGISLLHMIPIQLFNLVQNEISPMYGVCRGILGVTIPIVGIRLYRYVKKRSSGVHFLKIE